MTKHHAPEARGDRLANRILGGLVVGGVAMIFAGALFNTSAVQGGTAGPDAQAFLTHVTDNHLAVPTLVGNRASVTREPEVLVGTGLAVCDVLRAEHAAWGDRADSSAAYLTAVQDVRGSAAPFTDTEYRFVVAAHEYLCADIVFGG